MLLIKAQAQVPVPIFAKYSEKIIENVRNEIYKNLAGEILSSGKAELTEYMIKGVGYGFEPSKAFEAEVFIMSRDELKEIMSIINELRYLVSPDIRHMVLDLLNRIGEQTNKAEANANQGSKQ